MIIEGKNLIEINIPDSARSIGISNDTPWFNAQPYGLIYIGDVAFRWKGEMEQNAHVSFEDGTTIINGGVFGFQGNWSLASVSIPDSVKIIGDRAFGGIKYLQTIVIPQSVVKVGMGAFRDCGSLTNVIILNDNIEIDDRAFNGCYSLSEESRARILEINPNAVF